MYCIKRLTDEDVELYRNSQEEEKKTCADNYYLYARSHRRNFFYKIIKIPLEKIKSKVVCFKWVQFSF